MIIGITGGTGCGKTTALEAVRQLGGMVLDCDAIYHELLRSDKALLDAIAREFPGVVTDGVLDRKKLGKIVFSDAQALEALNRITHGAVKAKVRQMLDNAPELVAIDAIGLFEGGLAQLCQLTVAVTAPMESRIARLVARDGISAEYARMRIQAQRSQEEFVALCDYNLENAGSQAAFMDKCLAFFRSLDIIKEKN